MKQILCWNFTSRHRTSLCHIFIFRVEKFFFFLLPKKISFLPSISVCGGIFFYVCLIFFSFIFILHRAPSLLPSIVARFILFLFFFLSLLSPKLQLQFAFFCFCCWLLLLLVMLKASSNWMWKSEIIIFLSHWTHCCVCWLLQNNSREERQRRFFLFFCV